MCIDYDKKNHCRINMCTANCDITNNACVFIFVHKSVVDVSILILGLLSKHIADVGVLGLLRSRDNLAIALHLNWDLKGRISRPSNPH